MSKEVLLNKVLQKLAFYWVLAGVGIGLGFFIPSGIATIIMFVTLALLALTLVIKKFGKFVQKLYPIMAVAIGITLKYTLEFYIGSMGEDIVLLVFGSTIIIFVLMGLIGFKSSRNMTNLSKYLFVALISLVLVSIISIFVLQTTLIVGIISAVGVIIFSLYTMVDFNSIAQDDFSEEDVNSIAFNLFLDFINLLQHLLSLVNIFSKD